MEGINEKVKKSLNTRKQPLANNVYFSLKYFQNIFDTEEETKKKTLAFVILPLGILILSCINPQYNPVIYEN